jgi:hypothetical protein
MYIELYLSEKTWNFKLPKQFIALYIKEKTAFVSKYPVIISPKCNFEAMAKTNLDFKNRTKIYYPSKLPSISQDIKLPYGSHITEIFMFFL